MPPHPPQKFQEPSVCRLIDASKPHLEFKSHSAEDADTVPEEFHSHSLLETSLPIKLEDQPSLHRALRDSRKQGKRPVRFADKPAHEFGISDRAYTFTGRWIGPPEKEMAEAGFYCTGKDKACCAYCEVEIRCWKESDGPWKKHQAFSPFCRHLKRCGLNASEISVAGMTVRSFSYSSFYDLIRQY